MTRTGIDVVIPVTELPDEPGHIAAPALIEALWQRWVHIHMGNRLRRAPYTPIFAGGYINAQATGALATGAWRFTDGAVHLRFDDALGLLRVHAVAAAHFTALSMALLSLDENSSAPADEHVVNSPTCAQRVSVNSAARCASQAGPFPRTATRWPSWTRSTRRSSSCATRSM